MRQKAYQLYCCATDIYYWYSRKPSSSIVLCILVDILELYLFQFSIWFLCFPQRRRGFWSCFYKNQNWERCLIMTTISFDNKLSGKYHLQLEGKYQYLFHRRGKLLSGASHVTFLCVRRIDDQSLFCYRSRRLL